MNDNEFMLSDPSIDVIKTAMQRAGSTRPFHRVSSLLRDVVAEGKPGDTRRAVAVGTVSLTGSFPSSEHTEFELTTGRDREVVRCVVTVSHEGIATLDY